MKQCFDWWPMTNGANVKRDWVQELSEKENGGSFDRAGGAGRPVSLSPLIKSKFG